MCNSGSTGTGQASNSAPAGCFPVLNPPGGRDRLFLSPASASRQDAKGVSAVFFSKGAQPPTPGTDQEPPEKTGPARFFEILQSDSANLLKANLLFVLTCIPLVTIPPSVFAMNRVVRRLVLDQPVHCPADYFSAFRQHLGRSYAAFLMVALLLFFSGGGALFYLRRAGANPLLFLPFMLCTTIFLVTMLSSTYFYGLLADGSDLRSALRMALILGVGRPFRALLAALFCYGSLAVCALAFPFSAAYLLLIGFSLPCLVANFFIRTVLRRYAS